MSVPMLEVDAPLLAWHTQSSDSLKEVQENPSHSAATAYALVPPFEGWKTYGKRDAEPEGPKMNSDEDRKVRLGILLGLILTLLVGLAFVGLGVGVYMYGGSSRNTYTSPIIDEPTTESLPVHLRQYRVVLLRINQPTRLIISLAINGIITACTEVTGYVHSTTLKWALARQGRLRFNANLRLFIAAGGLFSVNGHISNALFAVSLILPYVASSLVMGKYAFYLTEEGEMDAAMGSNGPKPMVIPVITFVGPLVVGITLSIQAILALLSFCLTTVPTWSSNPIDVASSLLDLELVHHVPGRCMRPASSSDTTAINPIQPSERQPSAWASHKAVRRVVWFSWGLVAAELVWFGVMTGVSLGQVLFTPRFYGTYGDMVSPTFTLVVLLIIGVIQSVLTFGLHCCELVVTLSRDERMWRAASSAKGTRSTGNPLKTAFSSWESAGLLICKPLLHWVFGNAVSVDLGAGFNMMTGWILVLSLAVIPVAGFITYIARRRPHGPQPAAYGHMQTLVNLVDEWETTMYWGHKADGPPAHAGTSGKPLPPVHMDIDYAGLKLE